MFSSNNTRFAKTCAAALHTAVIAVLTSGLLWVLPRMVGLAAGLVLSFIESPPR